MLVAKIKQAVKNLFLSLEQSPRTETCPCCGYISLRDRGGFDICVMCFWEDDGNENSVYWREVPSGPNSVSLRDAQKNFLGYGACDEHALECVKNYRYEQRGLQKDPNFTLLPEVDLTGMEPYRDMTNPRTVIINDQPELVGEWKWRPISKNDSQL